MSHIYKKIRTVEKRIQTVKRHETDFFQSFKKDFHKPEAKKLRGLLALGFKAV